MASGKRLITALIMVAAASAFATTGPRLVVEEPNRELGSVNRDEAIELSFTVANRGDAELELEVRPTCGCTVVDYDRRIGQGENGTIRATITFGRAVGASSKIIRVVSNDDLQPTVDLKVVAQVVE